MIDVDSVLEGRCDLVRVQRNVTSSRCVIVFSHLEYPRGHFAMSRLLQSAHFNVIYVNCLDNSWYQLGLGEYTASIEETATLLRTLIDRIHVTDVVTIGMSMGGYAAILFGLLLKCRAVLSFTAELLLGEDHGRSIQLNRKQVFDPRYCSLGGLMEQNDTTFVCLIYGAYDIIDLSLLWPLASPIVEGKHCRIFFVSGDHQVTLRLAPAAILDKLMDKPVLDEGDLNTDLVVTTRQTVEELFAYSLIRKFQARKQPQKVYDLIQSLPSLSESVSLCLFLATACADLKRFDEGIAAVESGLRRDPQSHPLYHLCGLLNQGAGRLPQAHAAYSAAVAIRPEATISLHRLASTLVGLGRTDEAEAIYEDILRTHPKDAGASFHLGLLLIKSGRRDPGVAKLRISVELAPSDQRYREELARASLSSPGPGSVTA